MWVSTCHLSHSIKGPGLTDFDVLGFSFHTSVTIPEQWLSPYHSTQEMEVNKENAPLFPLCQIDCWIVTRGS